MGSKRHKERRVRRVASRPIDSTDTDGKTVSTVTEQAVEPTVTDGTQDGFAAEKIIMGTVDTMNTVSVDADSLTAQAESIAAQAEQQTIPPSQSGDPSQQPTEVVSMSVDDYNMIAFILCSQLSDILVPAWKVTDAEKQRLALAIGKALQLWFPDQVIPPKYIALLGVAGAAWSIASTRRDKETGAFMPRKLQPKDEPKEAERKAA